MLIQYSLIIFATNNDDLCIIFHSQLYNPNPNTIQWRLRMTAKFRLIIQVSNNNMRMLTFYFDILVGGSAHNKSGADYYDMAYACLEVQSCFPETGIGAKHYDPLYCKCVNRCTPDKGWERGRCVVWKFHNSFGKQQFIQISCCFLQIYLLCV